MTDPQPRRDGNGLSLRRDRIDLVHEPEFDLGPVRVLPSTCEIDTPVARTRLEPRVMQVLVALASADGQTVSRDELVESCWGGLVVGDDAINRCIQRLRRLSETSAAAAFRIETFPRLGYRLVRTGSEAIEPAGPKAAARPWIGSLPALAGAAGLLLAVVVGFLAWAAKGQAPWSDRDTRNTFFIEPVTVTGDQALAAYAEQMKRALASRFDPQFGDGRLWPNAGPGARTPARYSVGLEFRRSGANAVTRVTLKRQATGAVLGVGEVSDPLGPAPSFAAVWRASGFVKPVALRREATLARAKPDWRRDAHDLLLMADDVPRDPSHQALAVTLLERALQLSPGQTYVRETLAATLDDRALLGWSVDPRGDMARAKAIARDLLRDNPADHRGLAVLADSYLLDGRWQDCLVASERLLAASPDDAVALEDKAQAELQLEDFAGADKTVAQLQPFQAMVDQFAYPHLAGKVRFHQGRFAEAARLFRQAVQAAPTEALDRPAFAGLRLYLAAAESEAGDLGDARTDLNDFRTAVPQVRSPSAFAIWNDAIRFPLTDWPRVRADLVRIGWTDS